MGWIVPHGGAKGKREPGRFEPGLSVRDIHIEDLVRILPILCSNEEFYTPRPLSGRVLQKKLHFPK